MASTHKHIRSSTANKRPTTAIADGQIALNTNSASPGLFFKDSTGATIIKIGPVHVGATAPNASPAAGGSAGNSSGEVWLDNSLTPVGVKIWNGSAWVNATPIGSTTVQGLLELATDAETQAGSDNARAVTPASLQSKVSDSTSTTSSTTIASSTAVKAAYDLANAALPKTGGTITGNLEIGTTGSLSFEGSTADGFETTIAVVDPTVDRTITLPNTTGTVVTTGDTGTVTSTMLADGTIVDADISATAEIAVSKLADGAARQLLQTDAAGTGVEWTSNIDIPGTLDVTGAAAFDSSVAVTGALTKSGSNVVTVGDTGTVTSTMIANDTIVNADINSAAAIAGTKISPDFGSQTITTSGLFSHALGTAAAPTVTFTGDTNTGIYSPGADQVAISTGGSGRLFVDASGNVGVGTASPFSTNGTNLHVLSTGTARLWLQSTTASTGRQFYVESLGTGGLTVVDGTTGQERLRITSAGLVGVGTSSPQAQLQVLDRIKISDSTQAQGSLQLGDGASTSFNVGVARWNGSTNAAGAGGLGYFSQGTANSGGHYFYTGDAAAGSQTPRMVILPEGNVGIGTSLPQQLLHVHNSSAADARLKISNSTTGSAQFDGFEFNCSSTGLAGIIQWEQQPIYFYTNNGTAVDPRLVITAAGNVGIGTASPGAPLTVTTTGTVLSGTANTYGFYVNPTSTGYVYLDALTGTTNNTSLVLRTYNNGTYNNVIQSISGNETTFSTAGTERARIDSSGRLLLGTSSSYGAFPAILQTQNNNGFAALFGKYSNNSSGPDVEFFKGRGGSASVRGIVQNGDQLGYIAFSGDDGTNGSVPGASIQAVVDGTPGANDMPGRLVFSTTADGASFPTERMRISSNGNVNFYNSGTNVAAFEIANSSGSFGNATARIFGVSRNTSTLRSINADGTINASGADYAEYMTKAGDFTIAKGDICGITADGLLTQSYTDAVNFVVKSTNPSYVGGDTWGSEDVVGPKPDAEDADALAQWEANLETARQRVDRIAFAGQVPVNVTGATPGQYIVPIEGDTGAITGIAKDEADLTLAEYMRAVGKVIAIEDDGRARIIVKAV